MSNIVPIIKDKLRFVLQFILKKRQYDTDCSLPGNIKLYYWKLSAQTQNLGDYLSEVVVRHFMPANISCKKPATLYSIGSVLGFRCHDAVVWGSGILSPGASRERNIRYSSLDIRAVRGPKTRDLLLRLGKSCPEVYGDPAILMPYIYRPTGTEKKYDVSLVFHFEDNKFPIPEGNNFHYIDIKTSDYHQFIDEIVQSKLVISSSLHGVILAETYGVPAILIQNKCAIVFKFQDWYASTGRMSFPIARSIEEALSLTPAPVPDLTEMQKKLVEVFPSDLWN